MENNSPKKESIGDALNNYKNASKSETELNPAINATIPKILPFNQNDFEKTMSKETDPDLMTSYEIIKLSSY